MTAAFTFALPDGLSAREPPERRGLARDGVRLLVIERRTRCIQHTRFTRIGDFLRAGDLLVFNSSRTLPAALPGRVADGGPAIEVRLAERLPDDSWLALLVCSGDSPFGCGLRAGLEIEFGLELSATVLSRDARIGRLWRVRFSKDRAELIDLLHRLGRPVRYEHLARPWALDDYQTVFAREPGSAEMPSAGRAFTWRLLFDLRKRGIETAEVVLHTGLSSYLDDELDATHPASEEQFRVSAEAADAVNRVRTAGRRVIAVGTTVVRALESAATWHGRVRAARGYTQLRVTAGHHLRVVDGLLTGLHEPEASHLDLLTAFVPVDVVRSAYEDAVRREYLWHEFGDLNLLL